MLFVKASRLVRNRVDEHCSDANRFSGAERTQHGVREQIGGEAFALPAPIDRESSE